MLISPQSNHQHRAEIVRPLYGSKRFAPGYFLEKGLPRYSSLLSVTFNEAIVSHKLLGLFVFEQRLACSWNTGVNFTFA